jgi:imidazole glycerol-phosphate synthase subunit HisH
MAGGRPFIAVLDYGIGNLRSAEKALQHLGADARLSADADEVARAAGVVLPGVGNFGRCMEALRRSGLDRVALDAAASGRPFLGICVGMQLLYDASEESPGERGLGLLAGVVRRLPEGVKRPQMQWNRLDVLDGGAGHPLFAGLEPRPWMYFVHSFAPDDPVNAIATCHYGADVVAASSLANVWATQFHPEKSGRNGLALLANFVATCTPAPAPASAPAPGAGLHGTAAGSPAPPEGARLASGPAG